MNHASWSQSDGVKTSGASLIQQSNDGYLWLAARGGLIRFDGVRFTMLDSSTTPALRSRLPGAFLPLLRDRDGNMWISRPDGGLVQYRDEVFRVVINSDSKHEDFMRLAQDGAGRVWIYSSLGVFNWDHGQLSKAKLPPGVSERAVSNVIADTGRGVWIGTFGGVWHMVDGRAEHFEAPDGARMAASPLIQTRDGTLWVYTNDLFRVHNNQWSRVRLNGKSIFAIKAVKGTHGEVLVATRGFGLLRILNSDIEQFDTRGGLSNAVLKDVIIDDGQNIWTTTEVGLDRLHTTPFTTIAGNDHAPFDTPIAIVGDAHEGLWLDTPIRGRLLHATGGIIDAQSGDVAWTEMMNIGKHGAHQVIGAARNGGVWLRGWNNDDEGVAFLGAHAVTHTAPIPAPLHSFANMVLDDKSAHQWLVISPRGLQRVHNGKVDTVLLEANGKQPYIASIAEDSSGHIWAAHNTRPILYELLDGKVIAVLDSAGGVKDQIALLRAAGGDTLWMAYNDGSLARMIGHTIRNFDAPDTRAILKGGSVALLTSHNDLWMAGSNGIARLSISALNAFADGRAPPPSLQYFTREDGLTTSRTAWTINRHAAFTARDGRVWFSTPSGLAVFDSSNEWHSTHPPTTHIEELIVDGRVMPRDSAITVPPAPDRVEIRYTAAGLRIPERARIEYKMEGADADWVKGNALRLATYVRLRPGHYTFRVRAWNEEGVPALNESVMSVRVMPRWFESAWFLTLALLALLSAGPLLVRTRQRSIAASGEQRLRERFDATLAERERLAREMHDTLLQGFTGVMLKLQAVQASIVPAPQTASLALAQILDASDDTLLDARQMIWDLRMRELDEHDLPDALVKATQDCVAGADIELRVVVHGERRRLASNIESTVFRIGRESVANIVNHSKATLVELDLTFAASEINLRVRDNGIGISPAVIEQAASRGHMGISGMRSRAARAGGTLRITALPSGGTEVALTIPLLT
ncbi:MAG: histidine kinase [Gemmatimonadaceae bacterium]